MNRFVPRALSNGRICCSSADALCARCRHYHTLEDPMSMTQDALARTLASRETATTKLAAEYHAVTGRRISQDAEHIAEQVVEELRQMREAEDNGVPRDPYKHHLAALRAAEQAPETPESRFERRYKAERLRALADEATLNDDAKAEVTALAAHRREVNADADAYAPPDPYQAALDRLRSER